MGSTWREITKRSHFFMRSDLNLCFHITTSQTMELKVKQKSDTSFLVSFLFVIIGP